MLGIILIIVVTIVLIVASYFGVIIYWVPKLIENLREAAGSSSEQMSDDIEKFDVELESVMETVSNLKPLDDFFEAQSKLKELQASIEEESGKMGKIEKLLSDAQVSVDGQEAKHNELKKGKEDCERLADDIRSNQEQLKADATRLETQLEDSRSHMNSLAGEVDLTADQKAALDQVQSTLDKHLTQVQELNRIYDLSSTRFITLEAQYGELEKEYRKLVDKELSGE